MPRGAPKGNKFAVGNKGGRTWHERMKKAIEKATMEANEDTIKKLAHQIVGRKLILMSEKEIVKDNEVKDFAMPITLKGMTDKSESKLKFNLDEDELKKVLADKLTKILTNDRPRLEQTNRGDENQEPKGEVQQDI